VGTYPSVPRIIAANAREVPFGSGRRYSCRSYRRAKKGAECDATSWIACIAAAQPEAKASRRTSSICCLQLRDSRDDHCSVSSLPRDKPWHGFNR
jgi:hypothetical protein